MGKNFEGKIGESDILEMPVKDPRTTSTIANYINVILDFTNFNPPTGFVAIMTQERGTGGITSDKITLSMCLSQRT